MRRKVSAVALLNAALIERENTKQALHETDERILKLTNDQALELFGKHQDPIRHP